MKLIRRNRGVLIIGALAVVVVVPTAILLRHFRRQPLLERATWIANTSQHQAAQWGDCYWWVSEHEVLLCRVSGDEKRPLDFVLKDIKTGAEHPLDTLSRVFADSEGRISPSATLSPDGKWLIWWCLHTGGTHQGVCYAALDGSQSNHWERAVATELKWSADSRRLYEFFQEDNNYGSYSRMLVRNVPPRSGAHRVPLQMRHLSGFVEALDDAAVYYGVTLPGERLLIETGLGSSLQSLTHDDFLVLDLAHGGILRKSTVVLPANNMVERVVCSPQGNRVAWLLTMNRPNPISVFLHRWVRSYPVRTEGITGLWVSSINGSGMHEVGHIMASSPPWYDQIKDTLTGRLLDIRWLPDGRTLSFEFNDNLYTVPAD